MPSDFTPHSFEQCVPPAMNPGQRHMHSNPNENLSRNLRRQCQHCTKSEAEDGIVLRKCSVCKLERYCSVECQRAAWPGHKRICKGRREVQAQFESVPGCLETYTALREFSGKHRSTAGACAFQSVRYYYLPPRSSDPIATSKVREDVLVIHLRTRPNAEEARAEKRFFATDVHLETISSYFREEQREDMRARLKWSREEATRNRGPASAVLVVWVVDDSTLPVRPASVMPSSFSLDQSEVSWLAFPWKAYLLRNLNEGIVL